MTPAWTPPGLHSPQLESRTSEKERLFRTRTRPPEAITGPAPLGPRWRSQPPTLGPGSCQVLALPSRLATANRLPPLPPPRKPARFVTHPCAAAPGGPFGVLQNGAGAPERPGPFAETEREGWEEKRGPASRGGPLAPG